MTDYQGNSNKSKEAKEPKKTLEKVVKGKVVVEQEKLGSKIKNIFFGGDMNTAGSYVLSEVLLPAFRNLLTEAISRGAEKLIYGENAARRRPPSYGSRVQYNNPVYRGAERSRSYLPDQRPVERWQSRKGFDDIVVQSKEDAENVVEQLINVVDKYEMVSVADLYELLGLPSTHVDNKWGWTHLSNIDVQQVREGWRISFPPLEEIS